MPACLLDPSELGVCNGEVKVAVEEVWFEFDDAPYAYQAGRDGIEILEHRDEWASATPVSH